MQTAVEQAFKNCLLPGRYPACVLYLEMSHAAVDVNVHPAKTEIKFSHEKRVFDLVYQAVLAALQSEDRLSGAPAAEKELRPSAKPAISAPATKPSPAPAAKPLPKEDFYRSMSAQEYRESQLKSPSSESVFQLRSYEVPYQTQMDMSSPAKKMSAPAEKNNFCEKFTEISAKQGLNEPKLVEKAVQNVEKPNFPEYRILGETMKLYILVEHKEALLLIDKHAAHERMIFDRLKAQGSSIMAQTLLSPVTLRLEGEDRELMEAQGELLAELGFELEEFGEREYILRAVPADMNPGDAEAAIEEILDKLRSGRKIDPAEARDEILHTTACKAAIKAGYQTEKEELKKLVEAVLSGELRYCPHGRPVSVRLDRKDLDKLFKRIL